MLRTLFWKMAHLNFQLLFGTGKITFPALKFLLWDFFFLFWIFFLHSSMHLALGRLKGVSVRKYHLREHKILHCTKKKRCGVGGEKTSEALQKYLFVLCSTALKLFNSFEPLKSVTCWQLFTWNVSFVWFETAEIITPKWEDYNTERKIAMYFTSSTTLLMTLHRPTDGIASILSVLFLRVHFYLRFFFLFVFLLIKLNWMNNISLEILSNLFWPTCYCKLTKPRHGF